MTVVTKLGSEILLDTNLSAFGYIETPSIGTLANGNLAVVWSDFDTALGDGSGAGIKVQLMTASGTLVGSQIQVNTTYPHNQMAPVVTSLGSGFAVVWQSDTSGSSDFVVTMRLFDQNGVPTSGEIAVATTFNQLTPRVTQLANGNVAVSWTGDDASAFGVDVQIFTAAGVKVGSAFVADTGTSGSQLYSDITALPGGGFVVTWQDNNTALANGTNALPVISGQVFAADGTKVGGQFEANTASLGGLTFARVAALADGKFVVVWQENNGQLYGDAQHADIVAQIYNANGTALGGNFLVNTKVDFDQTHADVVGLSGGGFVIAWEDSGSFIGSTEPDQSGSGIKAQVFDGSGARVGAEFLVNTVTDNNQVAPSLTALSGDRFTVTWQDYSGSTQTTQSLSVKAQTFTADNAPAIDSNGGGDNAAITISEDATAVATVHATDADAGTTLSYAIGGGADAALFQIDATTGALSFKAAPNFEAPADVGSNNVYDVIVTASDGTLADSQALAITVANKVDSAELSGPIYPAPGGNSFTSDGQPTGRDAGQVRTYGGFNLTTVGNLFWGLDPIKAAMDGAADSPGETLALASISGDGLTATYSGTTTAPGYGGTLYTRLVVTIQAAGSGTAHWVTAGSLGYSTGPAALVDVDEGVGAFSIKLQFQAATALNGVYDSFLDLYDAITTASTGAVTSSSGLFYGQLLDQPPTITSGGGGDSASYNVVAGTTAVTTVAASDPDAGTTLNYAIGGGADAALFQIDGATGALSFKVAPNYLAPADAGANNVYDVIVTASDGNLSDSQALAITVQPNFTIIDGTPGPDPLTGTAGADSITGQGGDDTITSGGGKDTILAGAGNDLVILDGAFASGSQLDGGADSDVLRVTQAAASLVTPNGNFVPLQNGSVAGFETLQFASQAGETLRAMMSFAELAGFTTLSGGAGTDVLAVLALTPGTYSLKALAFQNWDNVADIVSLVGTGNGAYNLSAQDHSGVYALNGGASNDVLDGSSGTELLNGGGGNDLLDGAGGNDTLNGGVGADTLTGGDGNDVLTGGTEADVFGISLGQDIVTDFAPGTDRVDVSGANFMSFAQLAPYTAQVGNDVVFSYLYNGVANTLTLQNVSLAALSANDFVLADPNGTAVLPGTENADVLLGRQANDTISGLGGNDALFGNGGNDSLDGGEGNDTLSGGAGNDTLAGGNGTDTADFSETTQGVSVNLVLGTASGSESGADTLSSIENVTGGSGNDSFYWMPDLGNATIDGAGGVDMVTASNVVQFAMTAAAGSVSLAVNGQTLTASHVEVFRIYGGLSSGATYTISGDFSSAMSGGIWQFNGFSSGNPPDVLDARLLTSANSIALTGNQGDDIFRMAVSGANDTFDGGTGFDMVDYSAATAAITMDLAAGTASGAQIGTDSLTSVEAVIGGTGNDVLKGDGNANSLSGGDGNDTIYSGGGLDSLLGGNGNDLLILDGAVGGGTAIGGGVGTDTLRFTSAAASLIAGGNAFVPLTSTGLSGVEVLQFGSASGEILRALIAPRQLADVTSLQGGAGSDVLVIALGAPGAYAIKGLTLTNWDAASDGIFVTTSGAGSYDLSIQNHDGIYNVIGGSAGDVITGSDGTEVLNGNGGNDDIAGGGGNDTLNGGAGNDTLTGGAGNDLLTGGSEADIFLPSRDHDTVTDFTIGTDKVDLSFLDFTSLAQLAPYMAQVGPDAVFSYLYDGVVNTLTLKGITLANLTASDFVFADPSGSVNVSTTDNADVLLGLNGNDTLNGLGGNDLIYGLGGADRIIGGPGADTLFGGAAVDTFVVAPGDFVGDRIGDYQLGETIALAGAPAAASAYRLVAFGPDTHLAIDSDGNGSFDQMVVLAGHITGQITVAPWSGDSTYQAVAIVANPQNAAITLVDPATTDASVVHYLVTFETPVAGVTAQDFALTASGLTGTGVQSVTPVSGSGGTQYAVAVGTGQGTGTLSLALADNLVTASQPSTNGSPPTMGDVGDVNSDGKADLILPNYYNANVAVLLGHGDGTFAPATTWTSASVGGDYSNYARLGDFNGDGKLDIVTTNYSEQSVSVLLGNGDGTFQPRIATSIGFGGDNPLVVDLDGDGKQDLVLGGSNNRVTFLKGNGDGTFAAPVSVGEAAGGTYAVADVTGDGAPELVINYGSAVETFAIGAGGALTLLNTAQIGAAAGGQTLLVVDVNGDGANDLVFNDYGGSRIGVMLNGEAGTFGPAAFFGFPTANPINIIATDANGDGKLDILGTGEAGAGILLGNGDGTFAGTETFATGSANRGTFGDLNGDGKVDLVTTNIFTSQVTALLDVAGNSASYTIARNAAPVAQGSTVTLAEDTRADGTVAATDANHDPLTYALVTGPAHGTLDFAADGSWQYVPDADFAGADGFTWTASDGQLTSNVATLALTVQPVNDAPEAGAGLSFPGTEDTAVVGQLTATDVDSAALTYQLGDAPQHGTVQIAADGSFTYAPDADWSGEDGFTFTASDGALVSLAAPVTFTIAPVNDAPVASAGSTDGLEDTDITGAVSATDVEGDPLAFAVTTAPGHGQLVLNADGTFAYTPDANFFGEDSFGFVANDGTVDSAAQVFTITVTPDNSDPAVITGDVAGQVMEAGTPGAPDAVVTGQLAADDPDGPTSFTAGTQGGTYGSLAIDAAGAWTYTLDQNAAATQALKTGDSVTDSFVVTTADGTEATIAITVLGADDATLFAGNLTGTVTEAALAGGTSQVTGLLSAVDPDGGAALDAQSLTGAYGSLQLAADGHWTYVLNNANPLVDGLSAGQSLTDTLTVTALDGTTQALVIIIAGANDLRNGTNGADLLLGTAGADTLNGNGGNDTLSGGLGADTLNGGNGTDTASFDGLAGGVTISLAVATAQDTGAGAVDTLISIENLIGTAQGDNLTGNAGANQIDGGNGNDAIDGGAGADTLIGGAGTDTAAFVSATSAVTVSLASQGSAQNTGAGNDVLTGFENLLGSAFGDALTGDGGANLIDGGAGNDTLAGGLGDDTLIGGIGLDTATYAAASGAVTASLLAGTASGAAGNDMLVGIENLIGSNFNDSLTGDAGANVLTGGSGDDTLDGGAGNDSLNGGTGTDTASYASAASAVTVSLAVTSAQNTLGAGTDVLSAIENLTGSDFADRLTGSTAANVINGGAGDDTIDGGAGNDTLYGGGGIDLLNYASAGSAVVASLAAGTASGGGGADLFSGFENLAGSNSNDTLTGDGAANLLLGGLGNDTLAGGLGNDTVNGEGGTDTASYAGASGAVAVSLAAGTATGADGSDTLIAIENVNGSAFNDTLTGDVSNNVLDGGSGNDTLEGGAGNDTLTGGLGTDTASYTNASAGVTVSLAITAAQATGGAGSDVIGGIENLTGSAFNDVLTGSSLANVLDGGAGNDRLNGGAGADTLTGGVGQDTFAFSLASDSTPAARDLITDFVKGTDHIDLTGIDAVPGGAHNAFVWGGAAPAARGLWFAYDAVANVTHVYGDANGNAATVEFQFDIAGNVALSVGDFLL